MNKLQRTFLRPAGRFFSVLVLLFACTLSSVSGQEWPTVGIEGFHEETLPSRLIYGRPAHERDRLIINVRDIQALTTDTFQYRFSYMGMVPGDYDLRNYVWVPDGMTTASLPAMHVTILPILPPDFQGDLTPAELRGVNIPGGYRKALLAVVILWGLMLPLIIYLTRRRKEEVIEVVEVPEPTLADRLRPLVEEAASGTLSRDGKALLERLLIGFWRRKLHLEGEMSHCIQQLKQHDEAGALVRALEDWLHRPPGTSRVDVAALLEPYHHVSADFEEEAKSEEPGAPNA